MTWKDSLNLPVSAQGEWAAKRFYGGPKLAAAYLPVAYALLGEVKNRMTYGGVNYGHLAIELPDGTRIRVIRNGEQNILEIETVPPVGREISPETGSAGMIFYPRTKSAPLGIYTPTGPAVRHPVPVNQRPFATLSYQYNEAENRFDLSAAAPVNTQSGNQFFQEPNGAVFSWWHSPHGDGPLIQDNNPDSTYTPFLANNTVNYRNVAKGGPVTLGRVIYRAGVPWFSVPTGNIVAGFWAGVVEVSNTFSEWRCLVALYSWTGTLTLQGYRNPTATPLGMVSMTVLPTSSAPLSWNLGNITNLRASWPVRFSLTGDKAAVIVGAIDRLMVVELNVSHTEINYEYSKAKETVFTLGLRRQTVTTRYAGHWQQYTDASGSPLPSQFGFQEHFMEGASIFVDAADRFPLALDYESSGALRVIYHVPDFAPATWVRHARSDVNLNVSKDSYVRESRLDGVYARHELIYEVTNTGFNREKLDYFSHYFSSGFSLVDSQNQVVLDYVKRTRTGENNITVLRVINSDSLSDNRRAPFISNWNNTDVSTNTGVYQTGDPGVRVVLSYIGVKSSALLHYTVESASGAYGNQVRTRSGYDRLQSQYPGTSTREIGVEGEVTYTYGDIKKVETSVILAVENNEHRYSDGAEAKTENTDTFRSWYSSVNAVVTSQGEVGTKNITYPMWSSVSGNYNTCNIYAAVMSGSPTPWNIVTVTNQPDQPISLAVITGLFNPWAAIDFSYVRDERLEGHPVWAYSLKFAWESSFAMPGGVIIPLKLSDTKTDSTFGPLIQHVFLLDADGVITDQPVADPTLTTHPIGLF